MIQTMSETRSSRQTVFRNESGQLHQTNEPALIEYRTNRTLHWVEYYIQGQLHRTNGPAALAYRTNGTLEREAFYQHRVYHRTDGPAVIGYDNQGQILYQYYYLQGRLQHTRNT